LIVFQIAPPGAFCSATRYVGAIRATELKDRAKLKGWPNK
jgi:hypothetical protein